MASWRCLGIDFSAKQLEMARSGAEELAVSDRVEYREQPTAALGYSTMGFCINRVNETNLSSSLPSHLYFRVKIKLFM